MTRSDWHWGRVLYWSEKARTAHPTLAEVYRALALESLDEMRACLARETAAAAA